MYALTIESVMYAMICTQSDVAYALRSYDKSKHILRRFYLIREFIVEGHVVMEGVLLIENVIDPLTKP